MPWRKTLRETLEAFGHGHAYDYMFSLINQNDIRETDVKELHRLFYCGIDEEMKQLCQWICNERRLYDEITFAAELHRRFIFIWKRVLSCGLY